MKIHPAAKCIPSMSSEEFEELVDDIRENGLKVPPVFHGDVLLDGRHRIKACERLGVDYDYDEWDGKGSPTSFVISMNLRRRQLSKSQLAMIAVDLLPEFKAEAKERQRNGGSRGGARKGHCKNTVTLTAASEAASAVGVSESQVAKAAALKKADPKAAKRVADGELTLNKAAKKTEKPTIDEEVDRSPGMRWSRLIADLQTYANSVEKHGIRRIASRWTEEQKSDIKKRLRRLASRLESFAKEL